MASSTKDVLDLRRAGTRQWVMKVPRFLMDHLTEQAKAGPNASLGTVIKSSGAASSSNGAASKAPALRGGSVGQSYTLTLPDDGNLPDTLPREYEMRFTEPPPATYILSRTPGAPAHEGRVDGRGEIRPKDTQAYRNLIKERGELAGIRKAVETIEDDREIKKRALNHRAARLEEKAEKEKKVDQRQQKATLRGNKAKLSQSDLKIAIKTLFAGKEYVPRQEMLHLGSNQAISAALEELCDKVTTKGDPHYGDYKLKDAFRTG